MLGDDQEQTGALATNPPDPTDPPPQPDPQPDPKPTPAYDPDAYDRDLIAQRKGARQAMLVASMHQAVDSPPEKASKVVALADKLGLPSSVVEKNYDALSRSVQLRDVDYNNLLAHHPEVASWLTIPENAAVAHDALPQLSELDKAFKRLANPDAEVTGALPEGYRFLPDGQIRGPLSADGKTQPVVYRDIEALRQKFALQDQQETIAKAQLDAEAERLQGQVFPHIGTGIAGSVASTLAALDRVSRAIFPTFDAPPSLAQDDSAGARLASLTPDEMSETSGRMNAASERLAPGVAGMLARNLGQLIGDAPLYLLGGEAVKPVTALGKAMGVVREGAGSLPTVAGSEYLADFFRTSAAYSPLGVRSGINSGAEHGPEYGAMDALINTVGPAAFGSRFGLSNALVRPGQETAAGSWAGAAGRLMAHVGSQGGAMASTELANALHEYATGVNPNALDTEQLVPRLAKAGAMGGLMSLAFQGPHQFGEQMRRQQVASYAALDDADQMGVAVQTAKASGLMERAPDRFAELIRGMIPAEARTRFYQKEDWEAAAEGAKMTPDDLAQHVGMEEQWRIARVTGKAMEVPTEKVITAATGMEDDAAITALLTNGRRLPTGKNAVEGAAFYKDAPEVIRKQLADLTSQAQRDAVSVTDPVYRDVHGQMLDAGRPELEADTIARLHAATFNQLAEKLTTAEKPVTGEDLYKPYKLRIATEGQLPRPDMLDALIERAQKGDIPSEREARGESLVEWLRKEGVQDPGGDLASMEVDTNLRPGTRKLIDPEGIGADIAAQRANDEGFIDDADPNTLYRAIGDELAGRPSFRAGNDHPQLGPIREALLALQKEIKRLGMEGRSAADIKAALADSANPAIAEYMQRLEVPSAYLRHEYLLKQWKRAHGDRSPTPTDKDWQKLVKQADMVDEAQGRTFRQGDDEGDVRGSLSFNAQRHFLITLTGKANLSTVLHESGHFWLEVMGDHALRDDAPKALKDDYAKILDFLKVDKREDIGTPQHERFARATEQYLMDGHAPSAELRPVFQRFMLWLTDLYRKVKSLVTLTPEVRGVFDRMLASDDAIRAAKDEGAGSTLFRDRETSGMNEREWGAYLRANEDAHDAMRSRVFSAAMKTLRSERTKAYRQERAGLMEEAARIVNNRPVHIAEDYLVKGIGPDGKDLPEKPKLDRDELEREFGKGTLHLLPRGISEEGGIPLQAAVDAINLIAESRGSVGFRSVRDLWEGLRNLPDRKAEIRSLADGMMKARHPEMTDDALLEQAHQAVHDNDAQADVLTRESAALAIKAGRRAFPQAQLRAAAERIIGETNHLDVRPDLYLSAERKASREAFDAVAKGDYAHAFEAKQREELTHQLVKAAQDARKVIDKTDELMKDAKRSKTRAMLGKAGGQSFVVKGPDKQVVESFYDEDEAKRIAEEVGGTVTAGPDFQQAMDQLRNAWEDRAGRAQWDYATVKRLYDAAKQALHLARDAFTVQENGKRVAVSEAVAKGVAVQDATGKSAIRPFAKGGLAYKMMAFARRLDAFNRTMAAVAKEMDGEKSGGWHWEHFVRPFNHAADIESELRIADSEAMREAFDAWGKRGRLDEKVRIAAIGRDLSLENRIAVALNVGSTRNLERLMRNFGGDVGAVTKEQLEAITATLDERDWGLVRTLWDHFDRKWPAIEALQKKLSGIAPEKRDSIPVKTAFGTIDGKYYPIAYDPEGAARAMDIDLEKPQNPLFATPRSGFVETAVRSTGMPLRLDLSTVFKHNNDVAHFLSHAEALENVNKLLNNQAWKENTIKRFGVDSYNVIRNRIRQIAQGSQDQVGPVEQALRFVRQRSGAATMGFNLMSAISHTFGLSQSMHEVGAGRYLGAATKYFTNATTANSAKEFITARSSFMRNMSKTITMERVETLSQGTLARGPQWFRDNAYMFMHTMLWHINAPTWIAAYDHAMEDHPEDEGRAIALADQAVKDTQGSGLTVDMTSAQDKNELTKLVMQYGAFFTRTYQQLRPSVVGFRLSDPASIGKLAMDFGALVLLPTVIRQAFMQSVGKPDPSNDNSAAWWAKRLAKDNIEYLLSTIVLGREFSSAFEGRDYQGPAGFRSVALLSSLVKEVTDDKHYAGQKVARSAYLSAGNLFGIPVNQLDHLIQGYLYDSEHGTANPAPLLFGPPPRK